jgi:hypothetical protein
MPGRARRFLIGPPASSVRRHLMQCRAECRQRQDVQHTNEGQFEQRQRRNNYTRTRGNKNTTTLCTRTFSSARPCEHIQHASNAPAATIGCAPLRGPGTRAGARAPPPTMRWAGTEGAGRGMVDSKESLARGERERRKEREESVCERCSARAGWVAELWLQARFN